MAALFQSRIIKTSWLTGCLLVLSLIGCRPDKIQESAIVIITAGQSNSDGRVPNAELPAYIVHDGYRFCQWSYCSVTGAFEAFYPRSINENTHPDRWAYDAVIYHHLEQALQQPFYVVKWTQGGTAIDPSCNSKDNNYWCADPQWLKDNHSTATNGHSLLLSLAESIGACIDSTLSKLPIGYRFKAFLWHQGESDAHAGNRYYDNLKAVIAYVRNYLVQKTGDKSYTNLPFICGTVAQTNHQYDADVEQAMLRLARDEQNFHVVDMSDAELQSDGLHFTARASEHLGSQIYNILIANHIITPVK